MTSWLPEKVFQTSILRVLPYHLAIYQAVNLGTFAIRLFEQKTKANGISLLETWGEK